MKLLFDHNLAPRLVRDLEHVFPGSRHVRNVELDEADDRQIWEHARDQAFVIVSKDDDFRQLAFLHGAPPKVIWLRVGNGPTSEIRQILATNVDSISEFGQSTEASLLVLPGLPF